MVSRMDLQKKLEDILQTRNVYFQPPATIKMSYPCIIYDFAKPVLLRADNAIYKENINYSVTLITSDPTNTTWRDILALPYCRYDRMFKSDNLYHYVFSITI